MILLSNTYRQASENPSFTDNTIDPENHLLWRFDRNRLEAEVVRDSILFISGRLNGEMGGPSIFPPLPSDLADFARYGRTGGLMSGAGRDRSGRTPAVGLYLPRAGLSRCR